MRRSAAAPAAAPPWEDEQVLDIRKLLPRAIRRAWLDEIRVAFGACEATIGRADGVLRFWTAHGHPRPWNRISGAS